MSWQEWFHWLRLILTTLGSVPALAFLVMTRPSQQLQPPIPMWVTWWQSLAIAVLLWTGALHSIEGLWGRQPVPTAVVLGAIIGSYLMLGFLRWTLMGWRLQRRFGWQRWFRPSGAPVEPVVPPERPRRGHGGEVRG